MMTDLERRARVSLEIYLFGYCDTNNLRALDVVAQRASRLRDSSDRAHRAVIEMRRTARQIAECDIDNLRPLDTKER